jgi:hypothetical protein
MIRIRWWTLALVVVAVAGVSAAATGIAATTSRTNARADVHAVGARTLTGGRVATAAAAGTKLAHYTLAASAFAPDGLHDTSEDYFNEWDPTALSNQDAGRCFNTNLALPNGAKLKSVTFYYTAGSAAMYAEFTAQDLAAHDDTPLASFDTTVGSDTFTSTTMKITGPGATVNTAQDAYAIGVCPNGDTTFSGVSVAYVPPAA